MWILYAVMAVIAIGGGIVGGALNALKPSSNDGKVILLASVLAVLLIAIVALFLL